MFLDQQAKLNDSHLAKDVADHCNKLYDVIRDLNVENEKLKEENKQFAGMFNVVVISEGEKVDKIEELKQKLQKIKDLHDDGFLDDPWEIDDNFGITLIADEDD